MFLEAIAVKFNWVLFLMALAAAEGGTSDGPPGPAGEVGKYQMTPPALRDVNKRFGTTYTMDCLRNDAIAERCAVLYLVRWGITGRSSYEQAARIYNGGPRGMRRESSRRYWLQRVEPEIRRLQACRARL